MNVDRPTPSTTAPAEAGSPWRVEVSRGSAADFHARPLPERPERAVWVCLVDRAALVLGSAQPMDHVDRAAALDAGIEVVRRRSGGGAVLVAPGQQVWIDIILPQRDPLWDDDIGRATHWLGECWAAVVRSFTVQSGVDVPVVLHRGGMVHGRWSDRVCFAGIGPGEVSIDERKIVGISQRRTRAGARFQSALLLWWRPEVLASLLHLDAAGELDDAGEPAALGGLRSVAVGLFDLVGNGPADVAVGADGVLSRFLAHLPGPVQHPAR